jgi:hypothetical protein
VDGVDLYFIQTESGPVKIGVAASPAKRLQNLQTGHHERLALICTIPNGHRLEGVLHERFAEGCIRGEWFRADTPGLGALISDLLHDRVPSWLEAHLDHTDGADIPHRCACGWPVEQELADRGVHSCWTCRKETR